MRSSVVKVALASVGAGLALTVSLPAAAMADQGGVPNQNATWQSGNGSPQGRKGSCIVPGSYFKQLAQQDGSNSGVAGMVPEVCTPAGQ